MTNSFGLGLLRLSTAGRPPWDEAVGVIHVALDLGVRLLDTADVYGRDESELHYGERLARAAVDSWPGPGQEVCIVTKAGLARRGDRWLPAGRPEQLRRAVEGSLRAMEVERLELLLLHARDPAVPYEEQLGALAELQGEGKVGRLGLCNTSPAAVHQAQRHFAVAAVQNELSVINRRAAVDGLVELARQLGVPFLAHRPLGGHAKTARLAKNRVLRPLAQRRAATPHEIALAALGEAGPHVIPLVGATRAESVRSSVRALGIRLDVSDRTALALKFSFAPRAAAVASAVAPPAPTTAATLPSGKGPGSGDEVVLLMGVQGAGKSELVESYVEAGYARLNRDQLGGTLDDLVPRLNGLLTAGQRRVVLDNTYPTRISRAPVIAAAQARGVPVRCRHLDTPLSEAMINVVLRMIRRYGLPLGPDEMKRLRKTDPNLPPPQAMFRWAASFEPPQLDEGFAVADVIPFRRRVDPSHTGKGLLLDVDGTLRRTLSGELYPRQPQDQRLLPGRRETLARWLEDGYELFFVSNQSGVASGRLGLSAMQAGFLRTAELLGLPVTEVAYCPHPARPVGCFCRKPLPGLGVYLIERHRLSPEHLVMVGDMDSDAQFAAAIGARYFDAEEFFNEG